jgi:hypothetical protein
MPKTKRLHPNTARGDGVMPSKYLKAPDEVCAYSSTAASTMDAMVKVTRLLVSMYKEDQRQITDTRERPERNNKGIRAWYPPQNKDTTVAQIKAKTISRFLLFTVSKTRSC